MADFWIRVHANISRKPIAFRASEALGVKRATAVGHLVMFWGAVSQHSRNGHVADYSDAQLEVWAEWEGKRGRFANFVRSQHLDDDGRIREWDEYGGSLEKSRERNRTRVAKWRERQTLGNGDVPITETSTETAMSPSRNGVKKRNETKRNEELPELLAPQPKKRAAPPVENWVGELGDWWVPNIGHVEFGQLGKLAKRIHATRGSEPIKRAALRYFAPAPAGKSGYRSVADFFATFAQWDTDAPTLTLAPHQPESPSDRLRRMGAL